MTYCGTDWIGMSEEDIPNTVTILTDLSRFPQLPDRLQQGILNMLFLARLLRSPTGFVADPAFRAGGQPLIDNTEVFFDGISQGAVVGGAAVALSTDIRRGALGVPGMNFSTLLERSVDFDPFVAVFTPSYPDRVDRTLGIGLVQICGTGRYQRLRRPPHRTPAAGHAEHEVLLHVAFGRDTSRADRRRGRGPHHRRGVTGPPTDRAAPTTSGALA